MRAGPGAAGVDRVVLQGLAAFRWAAWVWMAIALAIAGERVERPAIAVAAAAAALAFSAWATAMLHSDWRLLLDRRAVAAEVTIGASLLVLDGVVANEGTLFSTRQSLGSAWPFAGIISAGVAGGPLAGAVAGIALGAARVAAVIANGTDLDQAARVFSLVNTAVFYGLAGAAAGYVARLVRRAENEIAVARAREEVARTLHDGVLQTLALVERRADDPALARLAREQERDLREFLAGTTPSPAGDLAAGLRALAARFEDQFGGRVTVVVADDAPAPSPPAMTALLGAAGEALTNAGKHGGASSVTIYVEPDDGGGGVFCSVKDDGRGFDTATVEEGMGLTRSVRGRIAAVGGRAEVRSQVGNGTEVCLWVR